MNEQQQIAAFMAGPLFAVAGASGNRRKYGNKVLRLFMQHDLAVVPVNPNAAVIEGLPAVASLRDMTDLPHAVSIITPPDVTEIVVQQAIDLGIRHIWMQPGAESDRAIDLCEEASVNVIHSGPCILVVLGFREDFGA